MAGFISPFRFTNMEELLKEKLGQPEVSREGNPKKFIDKSDPRYQESIYAEPDRFPSLDTGTVASIGGGIKKLVAKPSLPDIRKTLLSDKRFGNLISIDALGEEGSTLKPGYIQVTVTGNHPAKGGSFSVEPDPDKILERLNQEAIKWSKPLSKTARPGGKDAEGIA